MAAFSDYVCEFLIAAFVGDKLILLNRISVSFSVTVMNSAEMLCTF